MRRGLTAAVVVSASAVVIGGGLVLVRRGADTPTTRPTLTGRVDLNQARGGAAPTYVAFKGSQGACTGTGDYTNVRIGMPITVEAENGRLVGQGWLAAGQVTTDGEEPACSFVFTVPGLAEATGYRINASDLESIDVTPEELQAEGWEVTLTIVP